MPAVEQLLYKNDMWDESSDANPLRWTQAGCDDDDEEVVEEEAARTFETSPIHELLIKAISASK